MVEGSLFDVAVVGGGACGLAVVIQLVEKGPKGFRVAIFERRDTVGPGLAYSKACSSARINTPAPEMGLSASNPGDFARWMKENPSEESGGDMYPFRNYYGKYIQSEMERITKLAETRSIELVVFKKEVTDIEQQRLRHTEVGWIIHTGDDKTYQAVRTVLTTGNHIRQMNKHLDGKPLYFASPWPSSRLLEIPKSGSVAILGSRLTAIDEAIYLTKRGHTGPIYLCSRTGQLPKVQGGSKKKDPKKYERAYSLYNLAREVEESSENAILKIARHIYEEVKGISANDSANDRRDAILHEKEEDRDTTEFRHVVEIAQRDENHIFRVLKESGATAERYWDSLSGASKHLFLSEYFSTWLGYRAAMPLWTGERLLRLLERGQVRILRIDSAKTISHSDSGYRVPTVSSGSSSEDAVHVDSLVEATGMEFDITRIETPLMKNLLSRDLVSPHPSGGVDVDFRTLQTKKGLYFIGSLTRGVHFHTTTLDRSVAHAEWVADDVLGFQPRKFLHVALFVGQDQISRLISDRLIPLLLGAGHMPFVYLSTTSRRNSKMRHEYTITSPRESILSNEDLYLTAQQLRQKYGIFVGSIRDTDDSAATVLSLKENYIDLGYSVHWPSRWKGEVIEYFQSPRQGLFILRPTRTPAAELNYSLQEIFHNYQVSRTAFASVDIQEKYPVRYSNATLNNERNESWQCAIRMALQHTEQVARGDNPTADRRTYQNTINTNAATGRYGLSIRAAPTITAG